MNKTAKAHFKDVDARVNSDELERGILEYWEKEKIFEKALEQTKDNELFTFYDGPPYATGKPHYGHILQSAIKDTVLRYKTMQGYHVPRRVGWDTHGLPVETIVEKQLGIKNKKDIETLGIEKFNQACRDVVFQYINEFTDTLKRIGRWADYDDAYATLNSEYMESEWWVFKQLWDQGLVYKAFRSTPYCIRCATPLSNFEVSMNYKEKHDQAVYVRLRVSDSALRLTSFAQGQMSKKTFLLIWTTTPWTLPANAAVAINPELQYVTVEHEGEQLIVAKDRVTALFGDEAKVVHVWKTDELLKLAYEPIYTFLPAENAYKVVTGAHVSAADGTGLVHMAPAFGEEDADVGKQHGLPVLRTVDTEGRFIDAVTPWAGQKVFDANKDIIRDLKERGLLFKQEHYAHSYPFCWRCDEPLIYYALDTWFIKVADLKARMLEINEQINWTPKHVKHGRFAKGIESAPDWAVSRNRYWSVPLPIWECGACGHRTAVGSVAELQALSGQTDIKDLHRPYIDEVAWTCQECGKGEAKRVPEVLDVWFDSGSMPYAQWHYPFERKEFVEKGFPADFIAESIEMTRAWFYVLHVVATALTTSDLGLGKDKPAFKNVIASGLIFAEDGRKLSKKLKNYPEIDPTLQKYGADVLRFYLLTSTSLGEPYRFSEKEMQQLQRNTYLTLWNVYSFFVRYANVHGWQPAKKQAASSHIFDAWILARLHQLENEVVERTNAYQIDTAGRAFITFVDDVSNWYVRRNRERFQRPSSPEEKDAAFGTLHTVLVRTSELLAPFMPFVSEEIYRNLQQVSSVHLAALPKDAASLVAEETATLQQMAGVREIVATGLALRAKAGIKVRQPLAELVVQTDSLLPELADIIQDEVNVKDVRFADAVAGDGYVVTDPEVRLRAALKTTLTLELEAEGIAREIIRHGQVLRRQAGYALNERIVVMYDVGRGSKVQAAIEAQAKNIAEALQADQLEHEIKNTDAHSELTVGQTVVRLAVRRSV